MVQTTAKGYPYPETSDSPHGPSQLQDLAERADTLTDAARMTETERDALSAPDLYDGRVVMIVDSGGVWQRIEIYHADDPADPDLGGTWRTILDRALADTLYAPIAARAVRVALGNSQTISDSTFTKVLFDTADSDAHGLFDSANNEITVDKTGWWLVSLSLRYEINSSGDRRYARILHNGSTVAQTVLGPSGGIYVLGVADVVEAASGDKIAGEAYQDSGADLNVQSGKNTTWLTATFLGET